jgi:hypothetical protein
MIWTAVLATAVGCYCLKIAGWSLPARWLDARPLQRAAAVLPLALLAGLVVVQSFGNGRSLSVDARAAGLAVGGLAALRRAPFIVIVLLAASTAALLRLI